MGVEAALDWLKAHEKEGLGRLMDWLRIPSVSTDPKFRGETRRAAEWAADHLRASGFEAELRETGTKAKPGHPIVWGTGGKEGGLHVLFYGHYDVQPPDPLELWESPPFEPVVKPASGEAGERIVARGAADDKGQVHMLLEALRAWSETSGGVPVRYTVMLEGEEESGSANLEPFLEAHRAELERADVCLVSDTGMLDRQTPAITYGVRGMAYTQITLHGPDQDLHSGLWGGRCPNPINELARVLSQLWDWQRRVAIPGFYDAVRDLTEEERAAWRKLRFDAGAALAKIGLPPAADIGEEGFTALEREWARPTCDVNGIWGGYTGEGAKTVIPQKASAKVSFRLVADQRPDAVVDSFRNWLEERTPPGCRWEFHDLHGGPPATVATDSPHLQAARRALRRASGVDAALIRSGGSIPVVGMFKSMLGLDTILMGFGLSDDRVHSPNEKFELECYRMGARAHALAIDEFSKLA